MNKKNASFTPKKTHYTYTISLTICLLLVVGNILFSLFYHFGNNECKQEYKIEPKNRSFAKYKFGDFLELDSTKTKVTSDSDKVNLLKAHLYQNREASYQSLKTSLVSNMGLMLVLLVLGLYILFYKPKEIHVPIVNLILPDKLFYVVIPFAILYMMFQFQLTLNAAIDTRLILETMADDLEQIGNGQVSYYYSNARNLVDQGLIDTWCTWYYNIFDGGTHANTHQSIAFLVLFGFYGVFFGLIFATCLNLIMSYSKANYNKTLAFLLIFTALINVVIWSLSLVAWFNHAALFMAWIWLVALIAVFIWNRNGEQYVTLLINNRKEKE